MKTFQTLFFSVSFVLFLALASFSTAQAHSHINGNTSQGHIPAIAFLLLKQQVVPPPPPTPVINLSPPPSPVQSGETVHLHADITGADSIQWVQVEGTSVINLVDATTQNPSFTAPSVINSETLKFELRTTLTGVTSTLPLQLVVNPAALHVDAGADQLVNEGAKVTLHASATPSTGVTYAWTQQSGSTVTINNSAAANPDFTATIPYVNPGAGTLGSFDGDLVFRVTVTSGGSTAWDEVLVQVNPPVIAPVTPTTPLSVNAGLDQVVSVNHLVHLHGVAAGGTSIGGNSGAAGYTYVWTQTNTGIGPTATLNNSTTANPDFTPTQAGRYVFEVTITDDNSDTATDSVVIDVKETLRVNLGRSTGIPAGAKLSLHPVVTGGSGNFSYKWDTDKPVTYVSGSDTDANPVVTHNPGATEDVTFTLTVTDTTLTVSASASYTVQFRVPQRVSSVNAGADKIVRSGDQVSLHAMATPDRGVAYQWQGPVGVTLTDTTDPNATFTAPTAEGDYVFTVTASTVANSITDTVTISVQAPLTTNAGADQVVTEGDNIFLHGTGAHGSGSYAYEWTVLGPVGSGATFADETDPNARFIPAHAGQEYTLQLAVTDAGNNTTLTDTVQITVLEYLSVDGGPDRTVAPGDDVTLHAVASRPGAFFQWTETAPATGIFINNADTDNADFIAPLTQQGYSFEVEAQKALAMFATDSVTITVQDPVSTNAGTDQTVVKGHLVHLHGSAAHGIPPYFYQWSEISKPQGATATLNNATTANPNFTPDKAGVYEFDLQVTDSTAPTAQVVHDTVTITVIEGLTVNAGADQTAEAGKTLQLRPTISDGVGPFTYAWTLPAGLSLEDNTMATDKDIHVSASPLATQSYTLQLTVTDTGDGNITVSDSVDLTFTVAIPKPDDPSKVSCRLSAEKCANIANGCPAGQRMVFALPNPDATVKIPTGDCEPITNQGEGGSCDFSTGRNAPTNATFSALQCGTGKPGELNAMICERLGKRNIKPCAPGELPYIKRINYDTGARDTLMGCMSRQQCTQVVPGLQPRDASDPNKALNDLCTSGKTSDPKFVQTRDYECTYCCVGDACNDTFGSCFVKSFTLWTSP